MSSGAGSPTVSGVKSLEVRWPVVLGAVALAFFQTGGTIGASRNQTGDRGIDALAIAIAVLGPLSLILLRRWPREVMAFVSAITVVYLLRDYAYGPVFACLAIATVSTDRARPPPGRVAGSRHSAAGQLRRRPACLP